MRPSDDFLEEWDRSDFWHAFQGAGLFGRFPRVVVPALLDPRLISVIPLGWEEKFSSFKNQQSSIVNTHKGVVEV
jgi:hypothetical protein